MIVFIIGLMVLFSGILNIFYVCKGNKRALFGAIFVFIGSLFMTYSLKEEIGRKAVKDYLRGKIAITYEDTYRDSLIIKKDTINNF